MANIKDNYTPVTVAINGEKTDIQSNETLLKSNKNRHFSASKKTFSYLLIFYEFLLQHWHNQRQQDYSGDED